MVKTRSQAKADPSKASCTASVSQPRQQSRPKKRLLPPSHTNNTDRSDCEVDTAGPSDYRAEENSPSKRPRSHNSASSSYCGGEEPEDIDPVEYWTKKSRWPAFLSHPKSDMARKRAKRDSESSSNTVQDEREIKAAPYRSEAYLLRLQSIGSFMEADEIGVAPESMAMVDRLRKETPSVPTWSLFDDDVFDKTRRIVFKKNEARVFRDISPLVVPSAMHLASREIGLHFLTDGYNEPWNQCIPVVEIRPQPDFAVGFSQAAFSKQQNDKLEPWVGDVFSGGRSLFMAIKKMCFPFPTCEVKSGKVGLDIADRQNANSMTVATRAIVEPFRSSKREAEINRQIVAFSVSRDQSTAQVYGHYPVIDGESTKYYADLVHSSGFMAPGGREKWSTYRLIRSIYTHWMPEHRKRICSAIDSIEKLDLEVGSLPGAEADMTT